MLAGIFFLTTAALAGPFPGGDDPFVRWPDHSTREGFGSTYGIAVADVDGDGWIDVLAPNAKTLWLNLDARNWASVEIPELYDVSSTQYGASFGDYDRDGLPDLSTEPRGNYVALLHNDGGATFTQLPATQFEHAPSYQSSETNLWHDVDGDGWLDLFSPAYYGYSGLWLNQGPDKDGNHSFDEIGQEIGIALSTTTALRPEGAQYVDMDRDGDAELYVCGEMLYNQSIPGDVWFETHWESGIEYAFDEGAAFADVDMDGDFDLGVLYHDVSWTSSIPNRALLIWENLGDGTFELMDPSTAEEINITIGYHLGMSFADWDLDGDQDLTFSDRFERNDFMESGEALYYRIETSAAQQNATPSWFDWDNDGDLDIALGVWSDEGQFYQSTLYDETPLEERRYLRVRPASWSDDISEGLETEFGAIVEVRVQGEAPEIRRRNFTASGHGYLNQSEYTLTFGLEGVASPVVDVAVDFTNPGDAGIWRVDASINPALAGLDVLSMADREVTVFRNGTVVLDGEMYAPSEDESPLLETPGGMWRPDAVDATASADAWVGLEVTVPGDDPERGAAVREVVVEGVLAEPVDCEGAAGNVFLWDVTDGAAELVAASSGPVQPDNRRVDVLTDFLLEPGRTYRVVARVSETRAFLPADSALWLEVTGAVGGAPADDACSAEPVFDAAAEPGERALTVRYRERVVDVPEPEDTGDTGIEDTGDTDPPDTDPPDTDPPDTTDDTSAMPSEDTGAYVDTGEGDDVKGGCGCVSTGPSGPAGPAGLALWGVVLVGMSRRRRLTPA